MFVIWLDKIFGDAIWYQALKKIAINAIVAAELTGLAGGEKKQKAISAIIEALNELNIKLPLPDFLLEWLVGLLIDTVVNILNKKFGKDWVNKLKDILQIQ
jgi:branched-subunit amino acid permease